LKFIIAQLPYHDLHDASHSEQVIKNIEALMPDSLIENLSCYELFLLYLSAYLHDCGMALPEWEIRLLRSTEGSEQLGGDQFQSSVKNDLKPPFRSSEALRFIEDRQSELYGNFERTKDFIFINKDENQFKKDLSRTLIDYQEFRNGYASELSQFISAGNISGYYEYSEFLRREYIRNMHAERVEAYVGNLSDLFSDRLGGSWGDSLAIDLAKICRAHGEDFVFIKNLDIKASYFGNEIANLQFLSIMLRLGDILHFSYDRAPKSLFAEKMIDSEESAKHWKAKFQGTHFTMNETDAEERIKIKCIAHCDDPVSYYFIHDYVNWIEEEINNYFSFIHSLGYSRNTKSLVSKYTLLLADKVDKSQIRFDERTFIPVPDMKFALNQKKILDLLMGIGLYKDKYLCLRELYQNALDACRCAVASYSNHDAAYKGLIEFGIGEAIVNREKRKYIYCCDNGMGMTKEIINHYFLNIGNSYYQSSEFKRRSVKWKEPFTPTSQFGIGILSCFMIGDKIEITTRHMDDNESAGETISFSIDGPHEHFYYRPPSDIDVEKIGNHGTIVKVFLHEEEEKKLNCDSIDRELLLIFGEHNDAFRKYNEVHYLRWDNSLYKILTNLIGAPDKRVSLIVAFTDGSLGKVRPWSTPLKLFELGATDEELSLIKEYLLYFDGYSYYDDYTCCKEFIETKALTVSHSGIEYYFLLNLPTSDMPVLNRRVLNSIHMTKHGKILVDGIGVEKGQISSHLSHILDNHHSIINFVGSERPTLSVDRNAITKFPDNIEKRFKELSDEIALTIVLEIKDHFSRYKVAIDSPIRQIVWDYIFSNFTTITTQLINHLVVTDDIDMMSEDLGKVIGKVTTLKKLASKNKVLLKSFDFRKLTLTSQIALLAKSLSARKTAVKDSDVIVESDQFDLSFFSWRKYSYWADRFPIAIKTNSWVGIYQQYDLVSALWPFVPTRLFNGIERSHVIEDISPRAKQLADYSNSIYGISTLDPVLIHPKFGIYSEERSLMQRLEKRNSVGRFDRASNNFWLGEIHNYTERHEERTNLFLYAFISSRELNDAEKDALKAYERDDSEYYFGVLKGWSILFLGKDSKTVIRPGIFSRDEMVALIPDSFWKENTDMKFAFLDGMPITQIR
jgi:molecular chaperone HtpG